MPDFSIELAVERIHSRQTREYFQEVLSSYISNNNRSAVVMLWSVAICDIIFKLQDLRDIFNDEKAGKILEGVEKKQTENPNNSSWELELVIEVKQKTNFLDNAEYQSLLNLQKQRHLCAHPVLSQTNLLYRPTKEDVRALIRNTMEGVLLKPPLLDDITRVLVKDISDRKGIFADDNDFSRYLVTKFLKNLPIEIEKKLFKALWRFTFRTSNEDTKENIDINYRALKILYYRERQTYRALIQQESHYFSQIGDDNSQLTRLSDFLSRDIGAYNLLNDSGRIPIKAYAESRRGRFLIAIYLSETVSEHVEKVKNYTNPNILYTSIGNPYWGLFVEYAELQGQKDVALDFGIYLYCQSGNYDDADNKFSVCIKPYLDSFTKFHFLNLFEGVENNPQVLTRRLAKEAHEAIKERADTVLGVNYDYSKYPKFCSSLK